MFLFSLCFIVVLFYSILFAGDFRSFVTTKLKEFAV